jgi:hypothetical protein
LPRLCHNCRQPGHYRHNCPNLQHQDQNLRAAKRAHGQTGLTLWVTPLCTNFFPTSSCNFESQDEILLKGVGCDAPGF